VFDSRKLLGFIETELEVLLVKKATKGQTLYTHIPRLPTKLLAIFTE
jgi:hypothetical protein